MSDYIIKIIPADPYYHAQEEKIRKILDYLKANVRADDITAKAYETPVFVDCGGNLEKIECPLCGAALDFGWWAEAVNTALEKQFQSLSVTLPCCGEKKSLNNLQYYFPCGFSCVEFHILNPLNEPSQECHASIQKMLGTPLRIIRAHV